MQPRIVISIAIVVIISIVVAYIYIGMQQAKKDANPEDVSIESEQSDYEEFDQLKALQEAGGSMSEEDRQAMLERLKQANN